MRLSLLILALLPLTGCGNQIFFFLRPNETEAIKVDAYAATVSAVRAEGKGHFEKALEWYQKALDSEPDSPVILRRCGRVYLILNQKTKGLECLSRASDLAGKRLDYHMDIASVYKKFGYLLLALKSYGVVLDRHMNHFEAIRESLVILQVLHKPHIAIPILRRMVQRSSGDRKIKIQLALVRNLRLHNRASSALALLDQLKRHKQFSSAIELEQLLTLTTMGKYQKAIQLANSVLTVRPRDIRINYTLANLLESTKQTDKARIIYRRILNIFHNQQPLRIALTPSQRLTVMGEICLKLRQYQTGVHHLLRARALDPSNRSTVLLLTRHLISRKKYQLAIRILESYLQQFSFDKEAKGELAYVYSKQGLNLQEAINYAIEGLEIKPLYQKYLFALGWSYFQKGQYQKAINVMARANLQGKSVEIQSALGYIYFCLGDVDKSAQWYRQASHLDPRNPRILKMLNQIKKLKSPSR